MTITHTPKIRPKSMKSDSEIYLNRFDYENLMNLSGVAIAKIDLRTFEAVEYNDAACTILGVTRQQCEEYYHHNMKTIFTGEYKKELKRLREKVIACLQSGERSFSMDMEMPTLTGSTWVSGSVSFQEYDPRTHIPKYLVTVYRDISEVIEARKKQEQAELYKEQITGMKRLIEAVPAGLGTVHIHHGESQPFIQLNKSFLSSVAVEADAMGVAGLEDFIQCVQPDERETFRKDFHTFLQTHNPKSRSYHLLLKTGQYAWFNIRASVRTLSKDSEIAYFVYTNINEQKRAETLLKENQMHYQKTVDDMHIRMWTFDMIGKRIIMGDNAATDTFLKKNCLPKVFENAPYSLLDMIQKEDQPKLLALFEELKKGRDASVDIWYKRRPGIEPNCQRESYHVIKDASGRPIKAYGVGSDITAEKNMEEQYTREMEFLKNNSDESLIAKGHCNLTQNTIMNYESHIDNTCMNLTSGQSYADAYTLMLSIAYNDDERKEMAEKLNKENLMERLQKGDTETTFQFRRTVDHEKPMWISVTAHTYTNPGSGDIEMFAYAYDITERMMIETVMNMISQYGIDFIGMININHNTFELLRKAPCIKFPEIHQKVDFDEYRKYACEQNLKGMEKIYTYAMTDTKHIIKLLNSKRSHTVTFSMQENGRTLSKQLDLMWFDPEKTTVLIVRTDVTPSYERDQLQLAKIEAAKMEAERANEAKSTFLSSMSHDLRTPLNGVLGFTSLALKENNPAKKQQYLEKINSSAGLLLDLVNDTLELSRIESGKSTIHEEIVNEEEIVPAVVSSLRPSAELKGIKLETDFSIITNHTVKCDKLKVEKIALNLISNAIKYTPEGGTVKVQFIPGPKDFPKCDYSLVVEDNGIGMSKDFLKHMFEPFSQEKREETRKTQGTGLGLAIVKRYVDQLQGRIDVKSTKHKGTRWIVSLPVHPAAPGEVVSQNTNPLKHLANKRVLLCEDNDMNIEIATMILKEKGIEVETAKNGQIGAEMFAASEAGYYDAILMDMCMPVMDGPSAVRRIRTMNRPDAETMPIVAMSADVFEDSIIASKEAGMDAYVTKPVNPDSLYHTLQNLFTNGRPIQKN